MSQLLSYFRDLEPQMVQWLMDLVNTDSPSDNKPALDRLARHLGDRFRRCGAEVERVPNPEAGDHLLARFSGPGAHGKPLLLLGHLDTVWGMGEAERRPARMEDGKIFGPASFDMRGGTTLMLALAHYLSSGQGKLKRPLTLLLDSDEEVGTRTARALIEREALDCRAVLVLEPCLPGGAVKTARKGVGTFVISASGVAAHSGVDYRKGVSAIQELAYQILELYKLNDLELGTTINPGVIHGGSRSNVIADRAELEVDVRVATMAEGERITACIQGLQPRVEGTRLTVRGNMNRPPLERKDQVIRLYREARQLAAELGIDLQEGSTGGGSDGCFTAALGVPTLDGLGPDGAGPHALHEHVLVESLAPRAALLTHLALNL